MRNCLEHAFKKTIAFEELEKFFNFPTMKFPPFFPHIWHYDVILTF